MTVSTKDPIHAGLRCPRHAPAGIPVQALKARWNDAASAKPSQGHPIARLYADSRVQKIYGGANEIMKDLIARKLLAG